MEDIIDQSERVRKARLRETHNQHNRETHGEFVEYSETKQQSNQNGIVPRS